MFKTTLLVWPGLYRDKLVLFKTKYNLLLKENIRSFVCDMSLRKLQGDLFCSSAASNFLGT